MSLEEQFEELLKSDSSKVTDFVADAQNYQNLFDAKEISFDEYTKNFYQI